MPQVINKNTLKLLRIPFSFFLMPLFLLALSQTTYIDIKTTIFSFLIIHLLVYPASNGYNSYIDKDTESIGGIEKPPLPTKELFYVTVVMDLMAIILSGIFVNILFAICISMYILASKAYSSKQIRLKKYSIIGFLVVVFFQGAFTLYMSKVGISNKVVDLNPTFLYLLIASSFQIAGAYPLTQIYQHEQDLKDGVVTLSYKLGYKGTFIFTIAMFGLSNLFYFLYFNATNQLTSFIILQICFSPIVIWFSVWFLKVLKNKQEANYKNTMRMNLIASCCIIFCFIILAILQHIK